MRAKLLDRSRHQSGLSPQFPWHDSRIAPEHFQLIVQPTICRWCVVANWRQFRGFGAGLNFICFRLLSDGLADTSFQSEQITHVFG